MPLLIDHLESPVGEVLILTDGEKLCALDFRGYEDRMNRLLEPRFDGQKWQDADDPQGVSSKLKAYFEGDVTAVDDIPVDTGGTAFQQRVWAALRKIPAGRTATYGELATKLGNSNASRAVGLANSLNPVAIVVPCHRVIGANGTLTGYAGGLDRKKWLLEHEGAPIGRPGSKKQPDLFDT